MYAIEKKVVLTRPSTCPISALDERPVIKAHLYNNSLNREYITLFVNKILIFKVRYYIIYFNIT